jgi:hypothetical protein
MAGIVEWLAPQWLLSKLAGEKSINLTTDPRSDAS